MTTQDDIGAKLAAGETVELPGGAELRPMRDGPWVALVMPYPDRKWFGVSNYPTAADAIGAARGRGLLG